MSIHDPLETPESALEYVRSYSTPTDHDEKHISRVKSEIEQVVKIYDRKIAKAGNHNWYPNHPATKAIMDDATKLHVKELSQIVRAAKRLLELIG